MTYPLYAREWSLTATTTAAIFAVYPVAVVLVLTLFGDLSDYVGLRKTLLLGLGASIAGVGLFSVAPDAPWVFAGRILMGIGVGLSAGPSAAALVEFGPPGKPAVASATTTGSQAIGLAAGVLVGGFLIQYAPLPTRLNFIVLLALLIALFIATWFLPHHTASEAKGRWRLRSVSVPRALHKVFGASATSVSLAYSIGAIMLSLGAQIAHDLIGSPNSLINGAIISLFPVVSGLTSLRTKQASNGLMLKLGAIASLICAGLLLASSENHNLLIFVTAMAVSGVSYSLLFSGGLNLVVAHAPHHHRAGALSAMFLVAYLLQGLTAIVLGLIATKFGLAAAVSIGAFTMALASVVSILLTLSVGKLNSP
jgi:MFS family permease